MQLTYEQNFKSRRPDGRHTSQLAAYMARLREYKALLQRPEQLDGETFSHWQAQVKAKLRELICLPEITDQPAPVRLWSQPREGYRLEKWELYPDDYGAVPFLMLIPDTATAENPAPAVLCQPGCWSSKEMLAGEIDREVLHTACTFNEERNQMAKYLVQNGMVALAFDNPETAECAVGDRLSITNELLVMGYLQMGINYPGVTTFQLMLALDFAKTLDFVDSDRLAVSAHSLGTMPATYLALLRDEVKAVIFNDAVLHSANRYASVTEVAEEDILECVIPYQLVPGLWKWFSMADLLAALAPRYLGLTEGGSHEATVAVRRAYEFAGVPDRLLVSYYTQYADPAQRKYDRPIPAFGLSPQEHFEYCYIDDPDHSFRQVPAVALLKKCFGL